MSDKQVKKFVKHTGIYAVGNIARQLTGFLMLPIYTRFLSPTDYGIIGLLIFSLNLVEIVFGAKLVQAIPKFYHGESDTSERMHIISTAWIVTVSACLVTTIVVMLNSTSIALLLFDSVAFSTVVMLYSINLVTLGIENYGLIYIRIQEKPVLFVSLGIAKLILQLSLNIWLVVFEQMGVLGVVISSVSASSAFAILLCIYTLRNTGFKFKKEKAIELIKFSWPLWLAGFAGLYIGSSNSYYLKELDSLGAVGLFVLAAKLSQILVLVVWTPINQYWQVERFKHYKADAPTPPIYRNMHKTICVLLVLGAFCVIVFSKPIIIYMSDIKFHSSYQAVMWLVLADLINCSTMFLNFSFHATSNTKIIRNNNYLTALAVTVFYFLLIPELGFVGAALALCLARLFQFIISLGASRNLYDLNIDVLFMGQMLLITAIIGYFSTYSFSDNMFFELIGRALMVAVGVIIVMLHIRKDEDINRYIRQFFTGLRANLNKPG